MHLWSNSFTPTSVSPIPQSFCSAPTLYTSELFGFWGFLQCSMAITLVAQICYLTMQSYCWLLLFNYGFSYVLLIWALTLIIMAIFLHVISQPSCRLPGSSGCVRHGQWQAAPILWLGGGGGCKLWLLLHRLAGWCRAGVGPVESLQSHCIHTQSHWSGGSTLCFPSWGTQVQSPGGYLCETGILLSALSRYITIYIFFNWTFVTTILWKNKFLAP